MKKLLCAALLMALLIAPQAKAADMLDSDYYWTTKSGSLLHKFVSCPILCGETEYELIVGTPEQATADGKMNVCRLCFVRYAKAFGIDPTAVYDTLMQGLNDEDLRYFYQVAQLELFSRIQEPVALYPGIYVVGHDIPEGEWRFDIVSNSGELAVYKDNQVYTSNISMPYFDIVLGVYTNEYSVGRLYLSDGNIVYVDGTMKMSPYTGVTVQP